MFDDMVDDYDDEDEAIDAVSPWMPYGCVGFSILPGVCAS